KLGNETIEFKARFGGSSREIAVPIDHVIAIYARENGQGMAFPMPAGAPSASADPEPVGAPARPVAVRGPRLARSEGATPKGLRSADRFETEPPPPEPPPKRPSLKRVK
ncbi:MAG: ClpXP protease specificity-enhancing factor SspB, partial [Caldimonas sp.]